jgi:hypothetical protein
MTDRARTAIGNSPAFAGRDHQGSSVPSQIIARPRVNGTAESFAQGADVTAELRVLVHCRQPNNRANYAIGVPHTYLSTCVDPIGHLRI